MTLLAQLVVAFWILLINVFTFYTIRIWEAGRIRKDLIKMYRFFGAYFYSNFISIYKYNSFQEKPVGNVNVVLFQPELDP
jgi:apolipoprotein N-acyltransferase